MADLGVILGDLDAESRTLDDVVADLPASDWARATPAEGWTVAHQIAHLTWTDGKALIATAHPEDWQAEVESLLTVGEHYVDEAAAEGADLSPGELLDRWRAGRARLAEALAAVPDEQKLPWYGPPMSAASMVTARLMETWAHGQDVYDALGLRREPTARLWHIARFGTRTRDFAYLLNSLAPCGRGVPGRAGRAGRHHLDVRARGRRAAAHRQRRGLLPGRHPAAAPGRHRSRGAGPRRRGVADRRAGLRRASGVR